MVRRAATFSADGAARTRRDLGDRRNLPADPAVSWSDRSALKRRFFIVVPVLLIIAVALISYQRRNAISRDLANRVLGDTELTVAAVDLDSLGPRRISFAELELVTASGIAITIVDMEVPLEFPSVTPEYASIGRISVSTEAAQTQPGRAMTPALQSILNLPERFPATAVTIQEVTVDDLPGIRNVVWNLAPALQRLAFEIDDFSISAELDASDSRGAQLTAYVATDARTDAAEITAFIETNAEDSRIRGYVETDGETGLALGRLFTLVPDELTGLTGELVGMLDLSLDQDAPGTATILAAAASQGDMTVTTQDRTLRGSVSTNAPAELRTTWPMDGWRLRVPRSNWFVDIPGVEQLPIKLSNASCESGISCELDAELGPASIALGGLSIDRFEATLPLTLDYAETLEMRLDSAPTWRMTGVRLGDAVIRAIIGIGLSDGMAELAPGSFTASASRLSTNLSNLSTKDYQLDALAVAATDLAIANGKLTATLRVPENSGRLTWRDYTIRLPAAEARLTADTQQIDLSLELQTEGGAAELRGSLQHRFADQDGALTIDGATVDFAALPIRNVITGLPEPLQLVAGNLAATGLTRWSGEGDALEVETELSLEIENAAASWRDMGAAGIAGRADAVITSDGIRFENGLGTAALVDVGTPIRDLRAEFFVPSSMQVDVTSLTFDMLGGSLSAEPFAYNMEDGSAEIDMQLSGIQLPFMAEMTGLERGQVEGSLSGAVPLRLESNAVVSAGGSLKNDPPGGVIRVGAGTATALADNTGVEYATRALGNFVFEALTSDVDYQADGDLLMSMRLEGVNPTMDPDQPIILNLGVENNVPELLRSLRALRSIEDILEARFGVRE